MLCYCEMALMPLGMGARVVFQLAVFLHTHTYPRTTTITLASKNVSFAFENFKLNIHILMFRNV